MDENIFANNPFISSFELRLNTNPLLIEIEAFLKGKRSYIEQVYTTSGTPSRLNKVEEIGKPMCNAEGVKNIMSKLRLIFNQHTVQGNIKEDSVYRMFYTSRVRRELTQMILVNRYKWNIEKNDVETIVDNIMNAVHPFFSRLLDNKERESYIPTIKQVDTTQITDNTQNKGGGMLSHIPGLGGSR